MRVTSAIFVSAVIRRALAAGASAVVVRHGSDEAGAIFVIVDHRDGTADLYSPAPQALLPGQGDFPADRLFTRVAERTGEADIAARLAREVRFDPDLWLVAIEDRDGRPFIEIAKD
jgi:hypothetical protein